MVFKQNEPARNGPSGGRTDWCNPSAIAAALHWGSRSPRYQTCLIMVAKVNGLGRNKETPKHADGSRPVHSPTRPAAGRTITPQVARAGRNRRDRDGRSSRAQRTPSLAQSLGGPWRPRRPGDRHSHGVSVDSRMTQPSPGRDAGRRTITVLLTQAVSRRRRLSDSELVARRPGGRRPHQVRGTVTCRL